MAISRPATGAGTRADRHRDREPLPDRTAGRAAGDTVTHQHIPDQRVGVQGTDQLDLRRAVTRLRAAHPDRQALVVGRAQHHLARIRTPLVRSRLRTARSDTPVRAEICPDVHPESA
jgi:hypothetical protein